MGNRTTRPLPPPLPVISSAASPAGLSTLTRLSTEPISFRLILVRHGVSCANLKKARGVSFSDYLDPELTRAGQEKAVARGALFRRYLADRDIHNPIVGASVLLRAQQTAYLMMHPELRDLFVVPYVSETDFFGSLVGAKDNKPMLPAEKARVLRSTLSKSGTLDLSILREPNPLPPKYDVPDIKKFVSWLGQYYLALAHHSAARKREEQNARIQKHLQNAPPLTNENEERYSNLRTRRNLLKTRRNALNPALRFGAAAGAGPGASKRFNAAMRAVGESYGPTTEARIAEIRAQEGETQAQMNELNRRRQRVANTQSKINELRAEPIDENPAFIIFTHGNFIQEFIKKVSGQTLSKEQRPNYSAFEFTVTLVPNAPPQIVYNGPFMYDFGVDANPRSPYTRTSRIDEGKECGGEGDQCRIRACGPSRVGIFGWRNPITRRANRSAPWPWVDWFGRPPEPVEKRLVGKGSGQVIVVGPPRPPGSVGDGDGDGGNSHFYGSPNVSRRSSINNSAGAGAGPVIITISEGQESNNEGHEAGAGAGAGAYAQRPVSGGTRRVHFIRKHRKTIRKHRS